jgi:hypothetical protein
VTSVGADDENLRRYLADFRALPSSPSKTSPSFSGASRGGDKAAKRRLVNGYLELALSLSLQHHSPRSPIWQAFTTLERTNVYVAYSCSRSPRAPHRPWCKGGLIHSTNISGPSDRVRARGAELPVHRVASSRLSGFRARHDSLGAEGDRATGRGGSDAHRPGQSRPSSDVRLPGL